MKKIILLLMSVFALNVTCVYAQELTKKEQKEQAEQKKKAEKAKKEAEKEREKQAKKEAKREAQFAKFVEMVNSYEHITIDTKNVAQLDSLVKHLNTMMVDVVVLEKEYQSVEMVSEPYVDEDGIPDTLWYARDKETQQRFTNEEAEKLLKSQRNTVRLQNVRAATLVAEGVSAAAAIASVPGMSALDKLSLAAEASSLLKQAKLIKYGLTSMNYHLKKNMEYLGFQLDNEGDDASEAELDDF